LRATVSGALVGGVLASGVGVLLLGGGWPGSGFILPGIIGGLCSLVAFLALYKALATGSMSIVAPIGATYPVVPVIYGLAQGERPEAGQLGGMALIVAGVLLASYVPSEEQDEIPVAPAPDIAGALVSPTTTLPGRVDARCLALAFVAAFASGGALTAASSAAETSPYWGLLVMRGTALVGIMIFILASRSGVGARVAALPSLLVIGALDTVATGLFALSSTYGYLSIVAVIASLYPIGTVALARLTLGERILPHQNVGVGIALTGVALIAIG
jgi:drug/metabolite transporter (DMT)-like permease